jgi:hypothetical protein
MIPDHQDDGIGSCGQVGCLLQHTLRLRRERGGSDSPDVRAAEFAFDYDGDRSAGVQV